MKKYEVADLFCGAGGSSTGAKKAIAELEGKMNLVAVNHWNTAIATHSANHPEALHVVEDVSIVDPEAVVESGYLDILMASPECTYHSRARGGQPIHDQGRMNPWAIMNWLTKLDVNSVLIENVPEFVDWGPLNKEGRPDKSKKGKHFEAWFMAFLALGYTAEWRMINAADYGDATTRTRFFLMARKDGRPIEWPEPSHAKESNPMFPERKPWRGAWEIIDWTNVGRSLLDDPKYQRKPLAENTRRRIARGLEKFGGPLAPLYIRLLDISGYETELADGSSAQPFFFGQHSGGASRSMDQPLFTILADGGIRLIQPDAEPFVQMNRTNSAPKSLEDPVPTITSSGGGGCFLLEPYIIRYNGNKNGKAHSTDEPLSAPQFNHKHGLIRPVLIQYYTGGNGFSSTELPLPTVTTKGCHALTQLVLLEANHGNRNKKDAEHRVHTVGETLHPLHSTRLALTEPVLVQTSQTNGNGSYTRSTESPLPTLTTKKDVTLVEPTVEALAYEKILESKIDPRRLVFVNGEPFILDIRFRMLQNPELARAMGFEDDERTYEFHGNISEVTKQIGNAVPVNLAAALVKAALSPG